MTRHKLTDICPEKILRAGIPADREHSPSVISLVSSPNVANLKRIVCNVLEPVLLRALVCKDEKAAAGETDICPYPEHRNNNATNLTCNDCKNVLAQIYIRLDQAHCNCTLRSCIIAFVEGQYLSKTDDLLERLRCSVDWLNVKIERPYFYIFYYGQPMFLCNANNSCKSINQKIKKIFNFYSQDEDVCIVAPVGRKSESLIINHEKRFSCKAS
jgi:hypothetical protein